MTVSIELVFDRPAEESVRADWGVLETAGHSSVGAYRSPTNRPHVTVLVRDELPPVDFTRALRLLPLGIEFGAPIVFDHGDRVVLARPVGPREALELVHRAVHDAAGPGRDAPHTTLDDWTPHVTLARRLQRGSLDAALALLASPTSGSAVGLRRWDSASRTALDLR